MFGLKLPEVRPGDNLADLIVGAAEDAGVGVRDRDVIVVASKIVSKARGLLYRVDRVSPSREACKVAGKAGLDPRFVELVLRKSDEVVAAVPMLRLVREGLVRMDRLFSGEEAWRLLEEYPTMLVTVRNGGIWSDSGLDSSNHPPGTFSYPPRNPDEEARKLSEAIQKLTGRRVAVVISDTEIFLRGSIDVARGSYGVPPVDRGFGRPDRYGKPKYGGVDCVADELAAAAALLMKQTGEGVPVVVVRGLSYDWSDEGISQYWIVDVGDLARILVATVKHTARVLGVFRALKNVLKLAFMFLVS